MIDFRKLALSAILSDGVIDDAEVKILKKELYGEGKPDAKALDFLVELRTEAQKKAKGTPLTNGFENFFFKAVQDALLEDGEISTKEANWLRKALFADGKIDDGEKKLLKKLKGEATKTSAQFEALYTEALGAGK